MAICTPTVYAVLNRNIVLLDIITSGLYTFSIYCPGSKQNDGQLADSKLPHYNSRLGLETFQTEDAFTHRTV